MLEQEIQIFFCFLHPSPQPLGNSCWEANLQIKTVNLDSFLTVILLTDRYLVKLWTSYSYKEQKRSYLNKSTAANIYFSVAMYNNCSNDKLI